MLKMTCLLILSLLYMHNLTIITSFQLTSFSSSMISKSSQPRLHSQRLYMVFDFFRKRTEEGIAQVQNIASKTIQGKFIEALSDSAEYIKTRQKIDAENLLRLTSGLARSRERLLSGINSVFIDENLDIKARLEILENVLLQADIGATTTNSIIADLSQYAISERLKEDDILPVLRERLIEALTISTPDRLNNTNYEGINFSKDPSEPTVIFVIGANGMGKTTTIGKIANINIYDIIGRLKNEGNATVLLGACDTFRAAAVEQLGEWAKRANVSIEVPFENERGGDPVPVVTRSVQRAKREGFDVVIIDTSGRLSNNFELTEQLQQMKAAIQRENPSAPHETLLVVDGSLGRNAVEQAAAWRKYVGVSGLVITKLDGTARGGFVISVVKDLGLPVKFIGVGEKIEDLRDFQPEIFVDALLGNNEKDSIQLKKKANYILSSNSNSNNNADQKLLNQNSLQQDDNPTNRLKASFSNNNNSNDNNDESTENIDGIVKINKPKRPKRVKPASMKKKK